MKVKFIARTVLNLGYADRVEAVEHTPGQTVDLADDVAQLLVSQGRAVPVKPVRRAVRKAAETR